MTFPAGVKALIDAIHADVKAALANVGGGSGLAPLYPIWAEENSTLQNNATEWAFGNGANTPDNQGVCLPFPSRLVATSMTLRSGSSDVTIGIYRNGSKVAEIATTDSRRGQGWWRTLTGSDVVDYAAGDTIGFRTVSASGTSSPNQVCAWFERAG